MIIAQCSKCRKRYKLKDHYAGKKVRCPNCRAKFRVPVPEGVPVTRATLRDELELLAADEFAEGPSADGPMLQVAQRRKRPLRLRKPVVVAVLLLVLLGGGAAAYFLLRGEAELTIPEDVHLALVRARREHPPCEEAEALKDWMFALRIMRRYTDLKGLLSEELQEADARIAEVEKTLRERRTTMEQLDSLLENAYADLEGGKASDAAKKLGRLLRDLSKVDCLEPGDQILRLDAEALLANARRKEPVRLVQRPGRASTARRPQRPATTPAGRGQSGQRQQVWEDSRQGNKTVVIDRPGSTLRWYAEPWANPVSLKLGTRAGAEEQLVRFQQQKGTHDKWVISINQPLDLTQFSALAVDIEASEPVMLAAGVWTNPGGLLFETQPRPVAKGKRSTATFPLKGRGFKSAETGWRYGGAVKNSNRTYKISLFFYRRAKSPLAICNLRLMTGQ